MFLRLVCIAAAAVMSFSNFSDSIAREDAVFTNTDKPIEEVCLYSAEVATRSVVFEQNSDRQCAASHLTKLMTALVAWKEIESGRLEIDSQTTVSPSANSMQGTQIWLNVGETITVRELLQSITISNANDAAVALAEAVCGSESEFVGLMNKRAYELGMLNTEFADCTGLNEKSVTTAADMGKLAAELAETDGLKEYYTTWMTDVRNGQAQLVSANRLIRYYDGILGFKVCAGSDGGLAVNAAQRGDMTVVSVVIGTADSDSAIEQSEELLNKGFSGYEICTPKLPEEAFEPVAVKGGTAAQASVSAQGRLSVLIPKGGASDVTYEIERVQGLEAPVKKGTEVGEISFYYNGEEICKAEIAASEDVSKMNFFVGFSRLFYLLM